MKLFFLPLIIFGFYLPSLAQVISPIEGEKFTINGYVKDHSNGEELIGATVYIKELETGAITNAYGFYSLTLPVGTYTLLYTYIGHQTMVEVINLNKDISLNIELPVETVLLEDIVVKGEREDINVADVTMSRNKIDIEQVKSLPALLGEPDIIKMVQLQPGVISAAEGTSGYFVRGGSADQNLVLIDEAPIYDPSHFFGLFSVFNADVIKDSELYKGGIPSQFGGRLSSILDVRTKDGNNKRLAGSAGIGSLASRVMLEGPIKKNNSSFLISGRRSYLDLFLRGRNVNKVYFYDANAKINWRKNNNNRFFLAAYVGRDVQEFGRDGKFSWGNATGTFRWNHLFSERLFSNTTLIFSNFDYGLEIFDPIEGLDWTAGLQEGSFKQDFSYFVSPKNELSFGYHGTVRRFDPGIITPNSDKSIFATTQLEKMYALDHAFYLGNEQQISSKLTVQYGLRLSIFQNTGPSTIYKYRDPKDNVNIDIIDSVKYKRWENIKTFQNLEPRFSARYLVNPSTSLKFSYNRMVQNIHLMSNATVSLPFNTWAPSSPYLNPQRSDQLALGYFRNFNDNMFEFSVEGYYKWMENLTDFADNA
ncbi:MAG: TonB-dependent receptor, partial [Cyclobacteriaceae bacterium]